MLRTSLLGLSLFLFVGCATTRVTLPPLPDPEAPIEERKVAFRQFSPVAHWKADHYRNGMYVGSSLESLVLKGGWNVSDPRDLTPLVDSDSPTATHIASMESKDKFRMGFGYGTGGLMLGTAGFGMLGLLMVGTAISDVVIIAGLGSLLLAGGMAFLILPVAIAYVVFTAQYTTEREAAFSTYPDSLRMRLRLKPEDVY